MRELESAAELEFSVNFRFPLLLDAEVFIRPRLEVKFGTEAPNFKGERGRGQFLDNRLSCWLT